jgi:hypothetical protein
MVLGYHLVWTAYGWWLPNDPRGSTSRSIASDVIAELGALHYGRKRVQPASREIRCFYERAEEVLKFPLLRFSLAEQMIENLQRGSCQSVIELGERRSDHPVWGGPGWKVFLDSEEDVRRTVRYVEENPTKARLPAQSWDFVTAYDGWPFHRRRG